MESFKCFQFLPHTIPHCGLNKPFMFLDRSAPNKNAIKVLDFVISFIVVDQPSFIPIPTWANLSGANVIMKFQALLLNMVF